MGGSLRRHKRARTTVIKRKKKVANKKLENKSRVPEELAAERPDMLLKMGERPEWEQDATLKANYKRMGLAGDVNAVFGRNADPMFVPGTEAAEELGDEESDDDLRAALGKVRSTGLAAPKRLTSHQRAIVARLLAKHGEDTRAMMMDRKLNPMQHSEGALRKLLDSYRHWSANSGVDFRVPMKGLWTK